MATRAGDLRERVGFYRPFTTDDGYGNTQVGFEDDPTFTPVAAEMAPKLGGESVLSGRITGTNFVNITVRSSSNTRGVDTSWKARDERSGVEYNIRSIIDPERGTPRRGRWLEMLCEQGVAT